MYKGEPVPRSALARHIAGALQVRMSLSAEAGTPQ